MKGPNEARVVVGMKGRRTSHTRHGGPTFGIRNRRFGTRPRVHPAPDRASTPRHAYRVATTRNSVTSMKGTIGSPRTQRSLDRTDPGTEVRNEAPTERQDPLLGHRGTRVTSLPVRPTQGTSLSGTRNQGAREGRYGITTEKARALSDTLASSGMSCRGLYLNPGYQPSAHRIPTRLSEELGPGRDKSEVWHRTGRQ